MVDSLKEFEGIEIIREKGLDYGRNCITGGEIHLLNELQESFKRAKSVDLIVSFLMESGVKLLKSTIEELIKNDIPIRILTGNYLNITEPSALYLLKDIGGDKIDLRFYNNPKKSFHPKAYILNYGEGEGDIFIGSSNMSRSALTSGIEWNYRLARNLSPVDYDDFKNTFEHLFLNESIIIDENELRGYSERWRRPQVFKDFDRFKEDNGHDDERKVIPLFEPRGAQIEALHNLRLCREEGFNKALVVAATGIGKTYLAAFDSKEYKRVLFIAHREEILKQAAKSFCNIRTGEEFSIFNGDNKDAKGNLVFASIQTLGKEQYLNEDFFKRDEFDYIIVDEFHHAVASNYMKVLNYFTPKFMLGLTATPERLDNKDVFSLCDYNTVYEIRLATAINKGFLVPFRYYGIYDEVVDYGNIDISKGKYDVKQLEEALMINKRGELILKSYLKYNSNRALGFCSSRLHAEYMAKYFNDNGIKSGVVISESNSEHYIDRNEAIKQLESGEVKVLFSVDMFNEGLDIPSIDMVMFLRPTESPTIFLQQLGRGLRKHKDKKYVNVLDFIGNYKKANMLPLILSGNTTSSYDVNKNGINNGDLYPDDCIVDFDFRLVDLFKTMEAANKKLDDLIKDDFMRIKDDLNHTPSRLEFFTYVDDDVYLNMKSKSSKNILNDYLTFLKGINSLNVEEEKLIGTEAHQFFIKLETTQMSMSYKMPLLRAFYNDGDIKLKLSQEDIYMNFKKFYDYKSNGVDLVKNNNGKNYKDFEPKDWMRIAKNPMDAFKKSCSEFFYSDGEYYCLNESLKPYVANDAFKRHFKDIIDYRTKRYYKERVEKK